MRRTWLVIVLVLAAASARAADEARDKAAVQQVFQRYIQSGIAGDVAWLTFDWTFTSKGWESHVYRRTRDGWRIVQLHYSVPPPMPPP